MEEEEDWVMRPWLAGKVDYRDLVYGTELDLGDIARMNEALDVDAENRYRINEYYRRNPPE